LNDDISKLLDKPTSKWKKNDWMKVAKLFATPRPKGIIAGVVHESFLKDISERVNYHGTSRQQIPKKPVGRPEVLTINHAKDMLRIFENKRQKLAQVKKVSHLKIKDKDVAMSFAENAKDILKARRISKYTLFREIQGRVKYLKRKMKLR